MTHEEIQNNKEEFIRIYKENISREGSEELLKWMEKTDFFTAPASSRFHYACEGGLCAHSISVYKTLMEKHFDEDSDDIESFKFMEKQLVKCFSVMNTRVTESFYAGSLDDFSVDRDVEQIKKLSHSIFG